MEATIVDDVRQQTNVDVKRTLLIMILTLGSSLNLKHLIYNPTPNSLGEKLAIHCLVPSHG